MGRSAELYVQAESILGEGPVWDEGREILYWVDIERGLLCSKSEAEDKIRQVEFGECITSAVLCENGEILLTGRDEIISYHPETGERRLLVQEKLPSHVRFNDGKCDSMGRYYITSMDTNEREALGALYYLDEMGHFYRAAEGLIIGNGMAWNKNQDILYVSDSGAGCIYAYEYLKETGKVKNRTVAVNIPKNTGVPDGICSDKEGNLWIAHYYGERVTRWNPVSGELLETIEIPAENATSCCFGGKRMNTLYITTSRMNLQGKSGKETYDGSIFAVETDTEGYPCSRYR